MRLCTPQFIISSLILMHAAVLSAQSVQPPVVLDGHQQRHQFVVGSTSQSVTFNELIPGQTYALVASVFPGQSLCLPDISLPAAVEPPVWNATAHELTFKATAKSMTFQLAYDCDWDAGAEAIQSLSLVCKNCVKKDLNEYIESLSAVLEVEGGGDPETLVKEVLIGGDCFDVSGVTFAGNSSQIGTFTQGLTNIGFSQGMIMATGAVQVAVGPNDQDNASQGFGNSTPDGDLAQLSGSAATFDLANIEFDFTPTQSPVTFEFVFASEEYCEYVGSQFNDAFGFFISGPGINGPFGGAENIAIIPGGQYVTINNVNHQSNSGLYVNNTGPNGVLCGQNPSFLPAVNEVQFDGFTRKFLAVANVIPCSTYHIKLKICDIGDGIYDSAVFLRSGSFDAGGNASVEFLVDGVPADQTYEDCGDVELHFDRVGGNTTQALSVQYTIQGTASNGADYTGIPFSVVIPAGQGGVTLPVNIINDLIPEGAESIIIKLNTACSCLNPQEELIILDLPVLDVVPDTVTICGPGVGVISANPVSGVEPYTYQWQNGATDQTTTVIANFSSNYRVTVTDACGKTTVETARVIVNPLPTAQLLGPPPQLCPGQSASMQVNFTGSGPWSFEYTLNGDPQPPVTDITDDPYTFVINQPGLYQITAVYDNAGCQGPGQGALLVTESALALTGVTTGVNCFGQANGSINTTVTGGQGPYNYAWQGPQNIVNTPDPVNLQAGTYSVTVTDGFGCNHVQTFNVPGPAAITPAILNITNVNCTNPTGGSINLDVSGGTPGYSYLWSNTATVQDPQNLAQGTYTVTITDTKGCTKTTTATVAGDLVQPNAEANVNGVITCVNQTLTLDGAGSSTGTNYTYNWTAAPGNIQSGNGTLNPVVTQAGTYTLVVTNTSNGCTKSDVVVVSADNALPTANGGPDQTLTCVLTNATLDGSGSSQGNNFTYSWTASNGGTIVGGQNSINPVVSTNGTYTLLVTNTTNGCTKTDVVNVNSNLTAPNSVVAQPALLTCVSNTVTINGSGSTPANGISYQWTTPNGNIVSGQTSPSAIVNEPGQYILVVTNTSNGCTDSESVSVSQDYAFPLAVANVNEQLDCNTDQVTFDGNGSSIGGVFAFNWTTNGGNFVSGQTSLTPVVDAPGAYTLIVTNTQNGCSSVETVQVGLDLQAPPVNAGPPATLTCINTTLTLGDPNAPGNYNYNWTATSGGNIVNGANTATPLVNQPGTYNLLVTNSANGCTSTTSIVIPQNITPPQATVAPGGEINCTTPALQLSGAGSSVGPNFIYDWSSSTGGGIGAGGSTLTPVVTAAATYTLLVTNTQNGCTSTASTVVTSNANLPTAVAVPSGIFTCAQQQIVLNGNGSTTGGTIQYNWGTVGGVIIGGQGSLQLTVGAPGLYTLVVTNTANNCTSSFSVNVDSDLTPPVSNAGANQILNCTIPALALDGTGSSQGNNYLYQWAAINGGNFVSPTNILNPLVNEPGTYQLLVTNTQNGCTSVSTVDIQQDANDPVVVVATPDVLNCYNSSITLNANGSTTGNNVIQSWGGPGIVSGGGSLNAIVNLPGDYTLVITNLDNGCTSEETVNVTLDVQSPPADAGPDNILNCYNPQLQLGGTGNPAGPGYTFNWNGPGIVSGINSATPVINAGGQYNLTVTNTNNGCTAVDLVDVSTNFVSPQANAGPTFELNCNTTSYTLGATGSTGNNITYNWSTSGGSFLSNTNILAPTINGAGFYFLTITDTDNGCTATSNVQITQSPDIPIATAGVPDQLTCAITALNLNGNGSSSGVNYIYNWTTDTQGNIISGNNTLTPQIDAPGVYTLAVTDTVKNCTSFSSVTISEDVTNPNIDAGIANLITCAHPTVSLQGVVNTNGTFSYQWQASNGGNIQSGANTLTPVVDATGTYSLLVTNQQNGCTSTDEVSVASNLVNPNVSIEPPTELTCVALTVTLDASGSSAGNMQYDWTTTSGNFSDLSNGLAPVVDAPGMYQLLITDLDNGCTDTASVSVSENIVYPVSVAGADGLLTCSITSLQLDGTNSSQNGNFFYQWTTSDGLILTGANSLEPTVVAGGTYTLVVVNNVNGCTSTDAAFINVDVQQPEVNIATPDVISCTQPQVTLAGASTPSSGVSYSWSTVSGNIVSGQNSAQAVVNAIGEYVFLVLNNNNGCSNTTLVNVTENIVLPTAEAGPPATLTCSIEKVTLQGVGSTGAIYTYAWSSAGGNIVSGNNTLNPVVNEAGTYMLTVTNTSTGCTQTDEVLIYRETNVPTTFEFELDPPTCQDNDGLISFGTITGGIGPYLYSIDNGDNYTAELDFDNIAPGTYSLWIQDINGCEINTELVVPKAPDPGIELIADIQISLGDSLQLKATLPPGYPYGLIDTVIWTPLSGLTFKSNSILDLLRPGAKPLTTTEYTVTILSTDGCEATDRVLIRVDNEPHIYIPNAFSPWDANGDNDIVYIFADGDQVVKVNKFLIFDRWGEKVFEAQNFQPNDPDYGWDGRLRGSLMNPAVFVYYAEVEMIDGRVILFKGDITLVR